MKSPFETQPTRAELWRGLAQHCPHDKLLAAYARQAEGDEKIQRYLEMSWWLKLTWKALDAADWLVRKLGNFNDFIAGLASIGFITFSILTVWHGAAMMVGAMYCGIFHCMIRVNQMRENSPVYISPMDDEEQHGEVKK